MKTFLIDGSHYATLAELLDANADDAELCAWARNAIAGDVFVDLQTCECIGEPIVSLKHRKSVAHWSSSDVTGGALTNVDVRFRCMPKGARWDAQARLDAGYCIDATNEIPLGGTYFGQACESPIGRVAFRG